MSDCVCCYEGRSSAGRNVPVSIDCAPYQPVEPAADWTTEEETAVTVDTGPPTGDRHPQTGYTADGRVGSEPPSPTQGQGQGQSRGIGQIKVGKIKTWKRSGLRWRFVSRLISRYMSRSESRFTSVSLNKYIDRGLDQGNACYNR